MLMCVAFGSSNFFFFGVNLHIFLTCYSFCSCSCSDGTRVPLKPDGANVAVTFENRLEFVQLAERCRLQVNHILCEYSEIACKYSSEYMAHVTRKLLERAVCVYGASILHLGAINSYVCVYT